MSHIFVSYSRTNTHEAAKVVSTLRANRFVVWQDTSSIKGGQNWINKISEGISNAHAVVVLWSAAAQGSKWVNQEISMADAEDKLIIPIDLDNTPLPPNLAIRNKLDWHGGSDSVLKNLVDQIPKEYQRQTLSLDLAKPLGEQASTIVTGWEAAERKIILVPLIESGYCRAEVFGFAETVIGQASDLIVALQVTRAETWPFLPDIYNSIIAEDPDFVSEKFFGIRITPPINAKREHRLDNDNSAEWLDAIDTTYDAIQVFCKSGRPTLHIYNMGTVALAFGMGMQFWRFWHVQLYNWVGDRYARVLDILPDQS